MAQTAASSRVRCTKVKQPEYASRTGWFWLPVPGSGIVRTIAVALAREGADVIVSDTAADSAAAIAREIASAGRRALSASADVAPAGRSAARV